MTRLVAGNWKMNGSLAANRELLDGLVSIPGVEIAVCVPYPYLAQAQQRPEGVALGAQDVSEYAAGAYTGEVSAAMLAEFGCRYAIVGHSERRALFGEEDATVGRKALAALQAGLVPIVCVGETLEEYESRRTAEVVTRQVEKGLANLDPAFAPKMVVAYEPIWAIGTGRTATTDDAQTVCAAIRGCVEEAFGAAAASAVRIQYGGSVKAANIAELIACPDIDGALVGGASLDADEFARICKLGV